MDERGCMTCSQSNHSHPLWLVMVFWLLVPLLLSGLLLIGLMDAAMHGVNWSMKRPWLSRFIAAWSRLRRSLARTPRSQARMRSGGPVTSPSYRPPHRR